MESFAQLESYDLLAIVEMLNPEMCGRNTPIFDGYRGQFFWHINGESCSDWLACYILEHGELHPGNSSKCKVLLSGTIKELSVPNFKIGAQFAIREGTKIIAIGKIIEVR
ncbi:hypothetical protein C1E24_20970 [Pseudoalteromonas phenolica]|uniref:Translation elongation factor EFTu/EF1A C-terminal domain-containing protein n=1 Tax=Pseudoalteromonas phenolica TaxID=161398 RepID=A0A5R9PVW9_9GAMM|nr:hypothetical protein C1E24_20970 [Pseudoalteromonas phenolica]